MNHKLREEVKEKKKVSLRESVTETVSKRYPQEVIALLYTECKRSAGPRTLGHVDKKKGGRVSAPLQRHRKTLE